MRYVVVGSKGFIGSSIYKSLKQIKGIKVLGFSRDEINLLNYNSCKQITKILSDDDVIIFCAAEAPVKNLEMFSNNILMLNNLLLSLSSIKIKRFIYLSSDAVYSDSMNIIDENSETNPENLHGIMHITREKIVKSIFFDNYLVVRPTLVYGYNDPHSGYGPNLFINRAVNKNHIELFGKGEELRDHIYINLLTDYMKLLIINNHVGVYNLVSGKLLNFYEIAQLVIDISKSYNINVSLKFKERSGPMPHNGYRHISNQKILKQFPEIKVESIENNIKSYFKNLL